MNHHTALRVIFGIAVFGMLFSGDLSYNELFTGGLAPCPSVGAPGTVLGYPACIYGFFMYLIVAVIAWLGMRKRP